MEQQFWMALRKWKAELLMGFHRNEHSVYRHRTSKTVLLLDTVLLVAIELLQPVVARSVPLERPCEEGVDTECDGKRLLAEPT